jgi:integrase
MADAIVSPGELADEIAALEKRLFELRQAKRQAAPPQPRIINKLTVRKIDTLTRPKMYADGNCLYLDFKEPPAKNWCFRYTRNGRTRDLGLGSYPEVSLAEARRLSAAARAKLRSGVDPVEERRQQRLAARLARQVMTFKQCADRYIRAHELAWSDKHREQWMQSLATHAYPQLGSLPVTAIDTPAVLGALEPLWYSHPETASRVRGRIERILDWAAVAGFRPGDQPNPARWRGHLAHTLPRRSQVAPPKNFAALPFAELPALWSRLVAEAATLGLGALALQLALLCATRTGETLKAEWCEVDVATRLWTIPPAHTKRRKEHRVPLSPPALAVIEQLRRLPPSAYLFPGENGRRPIGATSMLVVLRRLLGTVPNRSAGVTVHGTVRAAFASWAAECSAAPYEIRELCLAHEVGDATVRAYQRSDLLARRRSLMDAWAAFVTGPAPGPVVVPLRSAGGR